MRKHWLTIFIVIIVIGIAISINNDADSASGECLLRECTAEEMLRERDKVTIRDSCIPLHTATEELERKVVQIQHVDLDEIDSQRMIKFVQKYHKPDLIADAVKIYFSPRYETALIGFSFENCAVLQMPMLPDKVDKIVRGDIE